MNEKLIEKVNAELEKIGEQGINTANLQMLGELTDIQKDLYKVRNMEEQGWGRNYREGGNYSYNEGGNYGRGNYGRGNYNEGGYGGNYGRGGDRMYNYADQIYEGLDRYQEGRNSYGHNDERLKDGLDRLMFGVTMLVETAMEFAENPQEKEIIRRHIQKIRNI